MSPAPADNGDGYLAIILNSVVHFVMYLYYLIVAVSNYIPPWKQYALASYMSHTSSAMSKFAMLWLHTQVGHASANGPICANDMPRTILACRVPGARQPRHDYVRRLHRFFVCVVQQLQQANIHSAQQQ